MAYILPKEPRRLHCCHRRPRARCFCRVFPIQLAELTHLFTGCLINTLLLSDGAALFLRAPARRFFPLVSFRSGNRDDATSGARGDIFAAFAIRRPRISGPLWTRETGASLLLVFLLFFFFASFLFILARHEVGFDVPRGTLPAILVRLS